MVVLTSFIAVSRKINECEKRFGQLRRGRTLTLENGKLQAIEIKPTQEMRMRGENGSNDINMQCKRYKYIGRGKARQ